MATQTPPSDEQNESTDTSTSTNQPAAPRWTARWGLMVLLFASLVLNGIGLIYIAIGRGSGPVTRKGEITLGAFQFENSDARTRDVAEARFQLHIRLLPEQEEAGRERLQLRTFKVQQDIEELLRQAHGRDFVDPTLVELKRQIQARVNQSLDMNAIADVIVTGLAIDQNRSRAVARESTPQRLSNDHAG